MTSIEPGGDTAIGWTHFVYPESTLLDALCVITGYGLAELIVFRDRAPSRCWQQFSLFVVTALIVTLAVSHLLGLYGRRPRDAWADKARRLAVCGAIVVGVLTAVHQLGHRLPFERVPVSVVIAGCVLTTFGMGLVRSSFRLLVRMLQQGHGEPAPSGRGAS